MFDGKNGEEICIRDLNYYKHFINRRVYEFIIRLLGTEDFSLMDSPMFQELVENIKE